MAIRIWEPGQSTRVAGASDLARTDPPTAPGPDGWTPAHVVEVRSANPQGFLGAAVRFATGPVEEHPGQRLSTAMIDELAPYYAATFGIDEDFVRGELAKVYLYVGGPAASGNAAMTIGHHIFLPNGDDLRAILSPGGKRWLTHELAHTMQFLTYSNGNAYRFLGDYIDSVVIGRDPQELGRGGGPMVWGAAITGARMAGASDAHFGDPSLSIADRLTFSVLPAAAIGVPLGVTAGGGLAALAALQSKGGLNHIATGVALITAPMVVGAASGMAADRIGHVPAQIAGSVLGAGTTAALLHVLGRTPGASLPSRIAYGSGIALAGALGYLTATLSSNTIAGWSRNAATIRDVHALQHRAGDPDSSADRPYSEAIHDAHWNEIEAEAIAQRHVFQGEDVAEAHAYDGVVPSRSGSLRDRLTWGLWVPLTIGVPAAAALGGGIFGTRATAAAAAREIGGGANPVEAVVRALRSSTPQGRSLMRSLGQGAAVTVAPLVVGGLAGGVADEVGWGQTTSKLAGGGAAALAGGVLMTLLTRREGRSLIARTPAALAGAVIAGGVGFAAASLAVRAAHTDERRYRVAPHGTAIAQAE